MIQIKAIPGKGGDSQWFNRLNAFEQQETVRQVTFKRRNWPHLPDGYFSKRPNLSYPHILPKDNLHKTFWHKIAKQVVDYCHEEEIAIHSEALNLRSSQVCCFNFLFPLRKDRVLAKNLLQPLLPNVTEVLGIDFEYTGPLDKQNAIYQWLGEPASGKRGQNRTSIDAAITWENSDKKRGLSLVEWKYTERQYGECGGFRSRGNSKKNFCLQGLKNPENAAGNCYLTIGKNTGPIGTI